MDPGRRKASDRSDRPVWLGDVDDGRAWDHVRVHVQLLEDPRIDAYALAVYVGLARHAELASGDARPAQDTLAAYVGASWRTVHRAIAALADAGYLEIIPRPGKAHVYRLLKPPTLSVATTPDSPAGVEPSTPAPDATPPLTDTRSTPDQDADEQEPGTRTRQLGDSSSPSTQGVDDFVAGRPVDRIAGDDQARARLAIADARSKLARPA